MCSKLKLVLEVLRTRYPEQFQAGQARTLQRRFRDWRARHGVEPEVFFEQVAAPGREAAIISQKPSNQSLRAPPK